MTDITVYRVRGDLQYGEVFPGSDKVSILDLSEISKEEWRNFSYKIKKFTVDVNIISFFSSDFIIDKKSYNILSPGLQSCGDLLPVQLAERIYWWFRCNDKYYDFIIEEELEGKYISEHEYWYSIKKYVFDLKKLENAPLIFQCKQKMTAMFCTDRLKNLAEENGLVGFSFEPLWNSREGGLKLEDIPVVGPEAIEAGKKLEMQWKQNAQKYGLLKEALKEK